MDSGLNQKVVTISCELTNIPHFEHEIIHSKPSADNPQDIHMRNIIGIIIYFRDVS